MNKICPKETILEFLIKEGFPVDYQCKSGYCGFCRMVVKGTIEYKHQPLAKLDSDEVAICCALARSDIIIKTTNETSHLILLRQD